MKQWRACGLGMMVAGGLAAQAPDPGYRVGVVSESGDIVTWLRPAGGTLAVERVVPVGIMPADIDGPHNLAVLPDQRSYLVTIAHGVPFGTLWRFDYATDSVLGRATVELFPTTIAVTPDGEFAFVANSDFHGERPRTNVVSVVYLPAMAKITDLPVCDMPHGVKVNRAGTLAYVGCMHGDELLEIDVATLAVGRRAFTGRGHAQARHAGHTAPGAAAPARPERECQATFVSVSPDDRALYVACNAANTLQVWDAATLALRKEIPVGAGAYNAEPSPDGTLVIVTNKKDRSVSLIDTRSLTEVARIPTTKKIVHGVAYSPDGRYAYISQESIGADPGAVDVIDLGTRKVTHSVPVPAQPTGIAIVKVN